MRIVCISASQVPSDTANSIQVMKVCQAFARMGHEVVLLVPGAQPRSLKPEALQKHYGLQTLFTIEWLPTRSRRLFPWAAVRHARRLEADLLYAWPIQSAALGLLSGMSCMLEMHDLPSGSFGPLWFRLFVSLPGRKRLLPITEALRGVLARKFGALPSGQVIVAPDGVDLERYTSLSDPAAARRELGLPKVETVLCTGHLYAGRGADLFLALAGKFHQVSFIWVGGRPDDVEAWKTRAAGLSLSNVLFTGFVPNERIPLYQSAADVLLMPYQRSVATSGGGNTAEICSPMKMFEYMAAGRAILTSDLPVLHEVLDDSMAVFCPLDDPDAWEPALRGLLADEKRRHELGRNGQAAAGRYSWTERAKRSLQDADV
ncbi:MAG TPA: glycosyltransferase [Anaerolineales bacterium]|nr:glycosyltransferase [Anaerolineales bacterium]